MVFDFTDDYLRERFANASKSSMGERTLIEKIIPAINLREAWLEREMLPRELFLEDGIKELCMEVVAYGALYDTLPQLDVVLTQNGLATVGNNNLAPASAARSEAARASLGLLLFQSQEALLAQLRRNDQWLKSRWAYIFRRSLIVSLADNCTLAHDRTSDSFDLAKRMGLKAAIVEDSFADRYLSRELMAHLRRQNIAGSLSMEEEHVVERIRDAVRLSIVENEKPGEILIEIIEYIRQRPLAFPIWHGSRVADLFKDHRFVNDRRSGGFFM